MSIIRDFFERIGRAVPERAKDWRLLALATFTVLAAALAARHSLGSEARTQTSEGPIPAAAERRDPYEGIAIEAKAAYVLDMRTGRALFEHNADAVLPLASLTKVMMAVTAADMLQPHAVVRIDKSFLAEEGDNGLYADESWRLGDLLDFSLVASSNDAASAIAAVAGSVSSGAATLDVGRRAFIGEMNRKASRIGLSRTRFSNATGLDASDSESGGYGTARDAAKLLAYAVEEYPDILEATRYPRVSLSSLDNIRHYARNTNRRVDGIPGIIASKTGYTELSGGNLVVVFDAGLNRPIAISVLGSSFDGRFKDVEKLAAATLERLGAESTSEEQPVAAAKHQNNDY